MAKFRPLTHSLTHSLVHWSSLSIFLSCPSSQSISDLFPFSQMLAVPQDTFWSCKGHHCWIKRRSGPNPCIFPIPLSARSDQPNGQLTQCSKETSHKSKVLNQSNQCCSCCHACHAIHPLPIPDSATGSSCQPSVNRMTKSNQPTAFAFNAPLLRHENILSHTDEIGPSGDYPAEARTPGT